MKYEIKIPRQYGQVESFNADYDNVASFNACDKSDDNIDRLCGCIQIFMEFNAMLGFGTELIRLAHNFEEGKEIHIHPSTKETGPQEAMGMYLTPDSCELVIKCTSFPPIQECLKKCETEHQSKKE